LLPFHQVVYRVFQVALEISRKALLAVHVDFVDVSCSAEDALMLLPQASQNTLAVEDVPALKLKRRTVLQTDAADVVEFGVAQIL
jgi:hypothetical protein